MVCIRGWKRAGIMLATAALISVLGATPVLAQQRHHVQPGETLSEIAMRYQIPLNVLAAENQISNVDLIYAGEQIVVPGLASPPAQPASTGTGTRGASYRVQPGDTLWRIAQLRGTSLGELLAANPEIVDQNRIFVDQTLALPGVAGGGGPVQTGQSGSIPALLEQHARAYGIDVSLVQAIAWQESGWQQHVVSPAGALGVMQVMPATGAWIASDVIGQPLDFAGNTSDNIIAGVAYLRWLIDRSDSLDMALAAYYQGPGNLQNFGMFPETQQYLASIYAIRAHIVMYGVPPA